MDEITYTKVSKIYLMMKENTSAGELRDTLTEKLGKDFARTTQDSSYELFGETISMHTADKLRLVANARTLEQLTENVRTEWMKQQLHLSEISEEIKTIMRDNGIRHHGTWISDELCAYQSRFEEKDAMHEGKRFLSFAIEREMTKDPTTPEAKAAHKDIIKTIMSEITKVLPEFVAYATRMDCSVQIQANNKECTEALEE